MNPRFHARTWENNAVNERDIFIAARHIESAAERHTYLAEACGPDVDLRRRVEELLQADDQAGSFLAAESPAFTRLDAESPIREAPGSIIGPYKLLQQIGVGGMGVVFMAEQFEPVRRCVALKIIKPGMHTREVIARFEAERQALALMDHPNIAKVLDAGTTASGHPFFVMELVKGRPITEYCDEHRLTPRQRLELFIPVCQAIQHAHQKGLIHRDIKPSNILIAPYDGQPVVKVIDFGVAKATGQQLTEKTLFTQFGALVGTLEYMSPEQAELNNQDIDTRSDIYSLGVLLYELLTGTPPLDRARLKTAAFDELLRIIREDEPPKPSTRLSESHDTLPSISAQRQSEPAKLTKLVRGELDWIAMKALDKDRNRRYETANGFALDVQRYLADEPVQACPTSTWYRARKFMRKNRGVLVTTGIVAAALIAGSALSAWQAIEARAARILADQRLVLANTRLVNETEAREEANRHHQAANGNLHRAIDSVDQMVIRIGSEKNRNVSTAIISDALRFYEALLNEDKRDPTVRHRAAMGFHRVAWALQDLPVKTWPEQDLVLWKKAHRLLSELHKQYPESAIYAFDLAAAELALGWFPRSPETIRHMQNVVDLLEPLAARPPQDLSLALLLVANGRHCPAVVPPDVAKRDERESVSQVLICYLANAYRALAEEYVGQGKRDEGIALKEKAILIAQRAPDWNQSVLGWCYVDLMSPYESAGRFDDALAIVDKSLDCWRGLLETQPDSIEFRAWQIHALDRKAGLLLRGGRALDAFNPALVGLEAAMRLVDDFPTLESPHNLYNQVGATLNATLLAADSQFVARDPSEVMETTKQSAEVWKRLINEHPGQAGYHSGLIRCYQAQSRMLLVDGNADHLAAAKQAWLSAVEVAETIPGILLRQIELHYIAEVLIRSGQVQEAERLMKRAIDICRKFSNDFPTSIELQSEMARRYYNLGMLWKTSGRLQEAEQSIRAALEIQEKLVAQFPDSPNYLDRINGYQIELSRILWRNGQHKESNEVIEKLVSECREALVLKPTEPAIKQRAAAVLNNLAWELATVPEVEARNPTQAMEYAKQAVELVPDAGNWNTLGVAHYRAGDWKAAIDALERSEKFQPGAMLGFNGFFLAMAHLQLGHQDEARSWYERACAWTEKRRPENEELRRFRDEAAEILKLARKVPPTDDSSPKKSQIVPILP